MRPQTHWPSVWQFVLSSLAILSLWGCALLIAVFGLTGTLNDISSPGNPLSLFMMAASLALCGFLLIPSAGYALWRLVVPSAPPRLPSLRSIHLVVIILLLPAILWLGEKVVSTSSLAWLLLPFFHLAAVGLPVLVVLYLAVHGLPLGSPQRQWGVFGSGLVLGPSLILFVEFLAMLFYILVGTVYIASQPELTEQVKALMEWLTTSNPTPEMLIERLSPFLANPLVLLAIFSFAALVVPMIEEALKPVGVWLLFGRKLAPAAGFAAGALSGAGYALFESLALSSGGEQWAMLVVARMGTALIHTLTTALMGWALVLAWSKGNWLRLGLTYLGVVLLHGTWNTLALVATLAAIGKEGFFSIEATGLFAVLEIAAPFGLFILTLGALFALTGLNRFFRRAQPGTRLAEPSNPVL